MISHSFTASVPHHAVHYTVYFLRRFATKLISNFCSLYLALLHSITFDSIVLGKNMQGFSTEVFPEICFPEYHRELTSCSVFGLLNVNNAAKQNTRMPNGGAWLNWAGLTELRRVCRFLYCLYTSQPNKPVCFSRLRSHLKYTTGVMECAFLSLAVCWADTFTCQKPLCIHGDIKNKMNNYLMLY